MYPKRAKEVITEYTETTKIPLEDSKLMINHYYRTIRQKASAMNEHWNFRIWGLGNLKTSYSKVLKNFYIMRSSKVLAKKEGNNYVYEQTSEKIKQLIEMIRIFKTEKKREDFWKVKKKLYREQRNIKQYESKRDPRISMEEPGTDS